MQGRHTTFGNMCSSHLGVIALSKSGLAPVFESFLSGAPAIDSASTHITPSFEQPPSPEHSMISESHHRAARLHSVPQCVQLACTKHDRPTDMASKQRCDLRIGMLRSTADEILDLSLSMCGRRESITTRGADRDKSESNGIRAVMRTCTNACTIPPNTRGFGILMCQPSSAPQDCEATAL